MIYLLFKNSEIFIEYMETNLFHLGEIIHSNLIVSIIVIITLMVIISLIAIKGTNVIILDFKKILNYERINIFSELYNEEIREKEEQIKQAHTNDERQRLKNEKLKIEELHKKLSHLLKILQKPYEHLEQDIKGLKILNAIYYAIIIFISGSFIYYLSMYLIDERIKTFNKLFEIKDKLPDFGAIFGITIFYGTTIIFTLYIITYLIRQINQNRNLIDKYQLQNRKIEEIVSIIKAKTWIKDFKNFEEITSKFLDKLEENVMTNKECPATSEEKNEDEEAKILNGNDILPDPEGRSILYKSNLN
jgi:hypothetical protein